MRIESRKISSSIHLLSCKEPEAGFGAHLHEDYCIWLNSAGGEKYAYKGNTSILQAGEFGALSPCEIHANHGLEGCERHLQTFYIAPEYVSRCAEEMGISKEPDFGGRICNDAQLFSQLSNVHDFLFAEAEGLVHFGDAKLKKDELCFQTVCALLTRHGNKKIQTEKIMRPEVVKKVITYFRENLDCECSLERLAAENDCSRFQLMRSFKHQTGITPHAYLMQLRLERGRVLMMRGVGLAEAALAAGFSDQSHFTRTFKKIWGITPGAYSREFDAL